MKSKKIILSVFIIFTLASIFSINLNKVYAMDLNANEQFNVKASVKRKTYGYSLGPVHSSALGVKNPVQTIIWKLNALNIGNSDTIDTTKNLYCAKATVGFSNTNIEQTYTRYWNVKTERDTIQNDTLFNNNGSNCDYKLNTIVGENYEKILSNVTFPKRDYFLEVH